MVQVLLSYCLVSENVMDKIRKTAFFPSLFMGVKLGLSPRENVTSLERLKTGC